MDALALLRLQIEWGADEALDAEPADRLRAPPPSAPARELSRPQAVPATEPARPLGSPAERAVAAAAQADSLEALRAAIAAFDGCALRDTATNLVFAEGNADQGVLIIGDPPGSDEDRGGHPFAGPLGALLDRMLGSIGLDRSGVLLTPLIPWRPPGGRVPSPAEVTLCLPFLHRLIALTAPRRIVLFSTQGARVLLPAATGRRRQAATWVETSFPGTHLPIPVLSLPGLDTIQKTANARRDAWAGLRQLRRALDADT